MPSDPHRVTADHIRALAVDPAAMRGNRTTLVDTDHGIRIVNPGTVLEPGSGVRRMLLGRESLVEDAAADGMTLAAYVREHAGRVAAMLNDIIDND